jgi:uncharacterized membrane protein
MLAAFILALIAFLISMAILVYYIISRKIQSVIFWILGILICLSLSNIVYTLTHYFAV